MDKIHYRNLPVFFKIIFWPIKRLSFFYYRLIDTFTFTVWAEEGTESHSQQKLAFAYAGLKPHKEYYARVAFQGAYEERYLGKIWLWAVTQRQLKKRGYDCSFIVYEIDRYKQCFFWFRTVFRLPLWVVTELDLRDRENSIEMDGRFKKARKRMRQNQFTFEFTREEAEFKDFYFNMHVPYITQKHDRAALVETFEKLEKKFESGGLILARKDGQVIAGNLIDSAAGKPRLYCLGVREGFEDLVKEGLISAMEYFGIVWAAKRHAPSVNLGDAMGFLDDGSLRHKMGLGARITGACEPMYELRFRFVHFTEASKSFLIHHPFITVGRDRKLSAVFFADSPGPSPQGYEGLAGSRVYSFNELISNRRDNAAP